MDYSSLGRKYDAGRIGGYLSYPLQTVWRQELSESELDGLCRMVGRDKEDGAYLYFHFPYCRVICTYCACFVRATSQPEDKYEEYTDAIVREIDAKLSKNGGAPIYVGEVHWGGGTPSLMTAKQIEKVYREIDKRVTWTVDAVRSIEVYPDSTLLTDDKLTSLKDNGFTQISVGIESFDPKVLKAINRLQSPEGAAAVFENARAKGFAVHCDIVYGLPHQDPKSLTTTVDQVLALEPDRIATFAFLYTPRLIRRQSAIKPEWIPNSIERIALYRIMEDKILAHGYERVGVDHFVRGTQDPLAKAAREGNIVHHFQGYEPASRETFLGFGSSAISFIQGHYFQNKLSIQDYIDATKTGASTLQPRAAHRLTVDDRLRARIILGALMCNLQVDKDAIETQFGIDFDSYFADALEILGEMEADGLVGGTHSRKIEVTEAGRPLLRVICRSFDKYMSALSRPQKVSNS